MNNRNADTHSLHLKGLDYSVLQQCMHCGMCLPTCPTYVETKLERNSPRGRIALMRAIADDEMKLTKAFGEEMYYCLGCLACTTACPAGVDYAHLFEMARADVEEQGVLQRPERNFWRWLSLEVIFTRPRLLRILGRMLYVYQASGAQSLVRKLRLTAVLPKSLRELEPRAPAVRKRFSNQLIDPVEKSTPTRYRVGLLTGCVQDILLSEVNRDTVDCLLANGCEVITPSVQSCCGSLHAHNGDLELAKRMARTLLDAFDIEKLDAVITNAAGCGSHLKHYDRLLADDPVYAERAWQWSRKLKDIHEWLVSIQFRAPSASVQPENRRVTYHEACHLSHGQKITRQPRQLLQSIPGLDWIELPESTWCCGSAGVYNITQPEQAQKLLERKLDHIGPTQAAVVATANPGCHLQVEFGLRQRGWDVKVMHPISLLAEAYRNESQHSRLT
ncbi:MAG: (Fe-S)-binding protein [Verrucomicrobia bacterium]|nr:(Fe-S)-binding protein [Verrucomicrobiota bacterium]